VCVCEKSLCLCDLRQKARKSNKERDKRHLWKKPVREKSHLWLKIAHVTHTFVQGCFQVCHHTVRTLIMVSTSFPWNPTSVYLVASTLMKGAPANFAKRRAISVCIWVERAMRHTGRERGCRTQQHIKAIGSVLSQTIWVPSGEGKSPEGRSRHFINGLTSANVPCRHLSGQS